MKRDTQLMALSGDGVEENKQKWNSGEALQGT